MISAQEVPLHKDGDVVRGEHGLVFNPYNPLNVEIQLPHIQSLLVRYGVPPIVHNMNLYRRAFVHRSYTRRPDYENAQQNITIVERPADCLPLSTKSNDQLEYVGDGVLELVTKYLLYRRFPESNEGFKTDKKIAIVKNEAIGRIAHEMGLHQWFVLSKHAEETNNRTNLRKLGCLFEAFIGALFLDFNKLKIRDEERWFENLFASGPGFQMAQIFIENVFAEHVDWTALIQNDDNYKNLLQVKIQKEFKVTPYYLQLDETTGGPGVPGGPGGPSGYGYTMGVFLCLGQPIHAVHPRDAAAFTSVQAVHQMWQRQGRVFVLLGQAQHRNKRKAEQMASQRALQAWV